MYLDYYGFTEKPFTITPNPRFIFFSKIHNEAFALLLYGITKRFGFIELIGEVGTGKTTVLRTLLNQLSEENYRTALIFNPNLSVPDLMRAINREYGISASSGTGAELLDELNYFLLRENAAGRTVVLVIDEAQNLAPDVLEQIRLISNLETETDKLIQIVLAGQPELGRLLELPELRQINQRIALRYHLRPLNRADTKAYIEHRLGIAGGRGKVFFTAAAVWWLYRYSRGTPRLINTLCDRALLIGYTENRLKISGRMVTWAFKDVMLKPALQVSPFLWKSVLVAALLIIVALCGYQLLPVQTPSRAEVRSPSGDEAGGNAARHVPPSTTAPVTENNAAELKLALGRELAFLSETKTTQLAFNALATLWHVPPANIINGNLPLEIEVKRLARKRQMELTPFVGSLDQLLRLDYPALVPLSVNEKGPAILVALTGTRDGNVIISPHLLGRESLSRKELSLLWTNRAYILWRNSEKIPQRLKPGMKGMAVNKLQGLLREAGLAKIEVNGSYDAMMVRTIKEFQVSRGIKDTGVADSFTLLHLYKAGHGTAIPTLIENKKAGGI
jgi:general secretion pathway protein A